jgi:hypothetical protein
MKRRNFIGLSTLAATTGLLPAAGALALPPGAITGDRAYWADTLYKMASPVLLNMSRGELKKRMPVEYSPIWDGRDKSVAYMEAFGRLMAGLAPWLALPDEDTTEGRQRKTLRQQALLSLSNSVDPGNPDYLTWNREGQPLVDAAFIAHGFLRAPSALWTPLDPTTQRRFINEFKGLRRIKPPYSNWLLFAAIIETFLLMAGEQYDPLRIDIALHKMNEWYEGDGWYGDGPHFHFDYYNSYVIQPMLTDIQRTLAHIPGHLPAGTSAMAFAPGSSAVGAPRVYPATSEYDLSVRRMQRYGECLERLISPEGTFPAFGRSITYRMGVFQPLAQLALYDQLPPSLPPAQIRSALTAVMRRLLEAPGVFTTDGWLQLGFAGHQPEIADSYSNSGSMYLTSLVFLPLGLPAGHVFWADPSMDWTSRRAWSGQSFKIDHAVDY